MLKCDTSMKSYCKCRHLGHITIRKEDFGLVLSMRPQIAKKNQWRDKERVNERSQFILSKLVNKIKELEENSECVKMQLEQFDNSNINSMDIEQSKQEKINLDEVESLQIRYENLNINSKGEGWRCKRNE
ncbi:hypothetical protein MTR67_018992 [Solanum verrucosum]|uniref:Uncharacterized protein n=1 Tax=Solanum verrucosum TaxID=315347 RepID=A0AAF0QMU9_SOLVR|nr:hypothetical protein MTR67_018992 [Solanum verrucosum]